MEVAVVAMDVGVVGGRPMEEAEVETMDVEAGSCGYGGQGLRAAAMRGWRLLQWRRRRGRPRRRWPEAVFTEEGAVEVKVEVVLQRWWLWRVDGGGGGRRGMGGRVCSRGSGGVVGVMVESRELPDWERRRGDCLTGRGEEDGR
ncbi:unnamed protein product, partial [Cuscuta epithymum]